MYACVGNTGTCPEPFLPFFSKKNTAMTTLRGKNAMERAREGGNKEARR